MQVGCIDIGMQVEHIGMQVGRIGMQVGHIGMHVGRIAMFVNCGSGEARTGSLVVVKFLYDYVFGLSLPG